MNQIAEHGHCEICGRVVKFETRFCGTECEEKHKEAIGRKKRDAILLVVAFAVFLIATNIF